MTTAVTGGGRSGTAATGRRWYVTATHVRHFYVDGELVTRPASVAHAKEMGGMSTACGQWAYSWQRMLDVPFPPPRFAGSAVHTCEACLELVVGDW
ncbi:hypothetical protein [Nocardioides sp. J54]|uniref:hypothetical protein n=1 Tax=Nocardioides sp. J54 TaxID=935866 RepID=UPI0004915309|nr:hypothetical protein [Nocardioides sp. J54]